MVLESAKTKKLLWIYVQLYDQNDLHNDWKEGYSQQSNWINMNGPIENFIVEHDSVEYEKFTRWN